MGRSRGPRPYRQVQASTIFLRVPAPEWPAVKRGVKREFRSGVGPGKTQRMWTVKFPAPAVAYTVNHRGEYDARLMVLERAWQEPLGAISPESLAAEGFETLAEFRRHWMRREHSRFLPTRMVFAYRVRPWREEDREEQAALLLERLYGDFLSPVREPIAV